MHVVTHLCASWLVAAETTRDLRDCRLVTLAGVLPDGDGLLGLADSANKLLGRPETHYYLQYHHYLLHGLLAGLAFAGVAACFARRRWRVFGLALLVFHLHLAMDLLGSRGPDLLDLWPIHYLGPLARNPEWVWRWQWRLDGWQNAAVTVVLLAACLALAVRRGHSFVGVFSRRADAAFVRVLRNWRARLGRRAS